MSKVAVVIPAAGSGRRFGDDRNKIFRQLGGEPLFLRTLGVFARRADVVQLLLVVSEADEADILAEFGQSLTEMNVETVLGGTTRTESVRNALARLRDEVDLVAVHDAVRPCVAQTWIDAVFADADRHGAAVLAYPVHGTLKRADDNRRIEQTVSRDQLWEAQTPQVFRRTLIEQAYATDLQATDDANLVEQLGQPVKLTMGDPRNIKITTPADLAFAAAVWPTLPRS